MYVLLLFSTYMPSSTTLPIFAATGDYSSSGMCNPRIVEHRARSQFVCTIRGLLCSKILRWSESKLCMYIENIYSIKVLKPKNFHTGVHITIKVYEVHNLVISSHIPEQS